VTVQLSSLPHSLQTQLAAVPPSTPGATDARPAPLQTVAPSPTIAAS